jgi:hypothetical protein
MISHEISQVTRKLQKRTADMKKILVLALALTGMALAATKTYTINLLQPSKVGTMELKAGEYQVKVVDGTKAIFKNGKVHGETAVQIQDGDQKFSDTSVRLGEARQIREIRIGGTRTKLVFSE